MILETKIRKFYDQCIGLKGDPSAIAFSLAIGVFVGVTPMGQGAEADVARFRWTGGALRALEPMISERRLMALHGVTRLQEVAPALESVPDPDWVWIDFHIGLELSPATAADDRPWSAAETWRKAGQPWIGWIG
jgi:hypothetical protein